MCIHFQRKPIRSVSDIMAVDPQLRNLYHLEMLMGGVYLSNRRYIALSVALDADDRAMF